jgi:hypothetical protein
MPVDHEAFLTMREHLKVGPKGSTVNEYGTMFYVPRVESQWRSSMLLVSIAHLLNKVSLRCAVCLDS